MSAGWNFKYSITAALLCVLFSAMMDGSLIIIRFSLDFFWKFYFSIQYYSFLDLKPLFGNVSWTVGLARVTQIHKYRDGHARFVRFVTQTELFFTFVEKSREKKLATTPKANSAKKLLLTNRVFAVTVMT